MKLCCLLFTVNTVSFPYIGCFLCNDHCSVCDNASLFKYFIVHLLCIACSGKYAADDIILYSFLQVMAVEVTDGDPIIILCP